MSLPETASFAEFARIGRFKASYVTHLRHAGRLVLTDDGKAVKVRDSLERIQATRDPSKAGVVARHEAARAATGAEGAGAGQEGAGAGQEGYGRAAGAHAPPSATDAAGSGYQAARAVKEKYLAMAAKRDYEVSMGKLLDADQVVAVAADAAANLRSALENLPEILGPQVAAESDEARCRALIADAVEHALNEAARRLNRLAPEVRHA